MLTEEGEALYICSIKALNSAHRERSCLRNFDIRLQIYTESYPDDRNVGQFGCSESDL